MAKTSKARSPILEAVHDTASNLHRLGFIDQRKMQNLDVLCLAPIPPYDSAQIRNLRESFHISQAVLASVLNTSLSTIRKWEVGDGRQAPKRPFAQVAEPAGAQSAGGCVVTRRWGMLIAVFPDVHAGRNSLRAV